MPSLFKTIGAVLCLVFALCFAAPNAYSDSETPTFTCAGTCVSTPTAPAVTFPSPTLDITWNGFAPVLIGFPSEFSPTDRYTWSVFVIQPNGPMFPFHVTIDICDLAVVNGCGGNFIDSFTCPGCTLSGSGLNGEGELSFAPTAAPEPSSLALMLAGVGLVFAMRKRWTLGLHLAS
jgi:PEP-CTERM motif-containing protein